MRTMGVQRLEILINTIFHVLSTWHHNNVITWADCRGPETSPTLKHLRMALHCLAIYTSVRLLHIRWSSEAVEKTCHPVIKILELETTLEIMEQFPSSKVC
ncbi:hypothetical protein C5H14_08265 [Xylella fastidiosa]|nr:hypothetical protein C5H14_08265 [Xylella fastidiosa]